MSGVQGAFIGGLMGTFSHETPQAGVDPQAIDSMKQAQACNFATITGVCWNCFCNETDYRKRGY